MFADLIVPGPDLHDVNLSRKLFFVSFGSLQVPFRRSIGNQSRSFRRALRSCDFELAEPKRLWKDLRSAVAGAPDAELVHPVTKRVGMEIQDSRRTLWPLNNSARLLKGGEDMASFHFFQGGES
jgi:hypothetical protein